jgi:hypothetical protein
MILNNQENNTSPTTPNPTDTGEEIILPPIPTTPEGGNNHTPNPDPETTNNQSPNPAVSKQENPLPPNGGEREVEDILSAFENFRPPRTSSKTTLTMALNVGHLLDADNSDPEVANHQPTVTLPMSMLEQALAKKGEELKTAALNAIKLNHHLKMSKEALRNNTHTPEDSRRHSNSPRKARLLN